VTASPGALHEAREAAAVVRRQAEQQAEVNEVARLLRTYRPRFVVMLADGLAECAAATLRYALEAHLRLPVVSAPPGGDARGVLVLVLSPSGDAPDLLGTVGQARGAGALTCALVGDAGSPVARGAELLLTLGAAHRPSEGHLATLTLGARLLQAWQADPGLADALEVLPDALARVAGDGHEAAVAATALSRAVRAQVLGLGMHAGVAAHTARQLQSAAGLPAQAVGAPDPEPHAGTLTLGFQARDGTAPFTAATLRGQLDQGAPLLLIGDDLPGRPAHLPTPPTGHALTDAAVSAAGAHLLIAHAARPPSTSAHPH
jgi:glucosamine--fructose-6-phosphate aminotransferase (isomerizing)